MTGFAYINKFANTLSRKESKKNASFDDEISHPSTRVRG